jgi:hypothetical protein
MAVFTTKAGIIATTLKGFSPERITYKTYQYLLQLADQYTATTATDWTSLDGVSAAPTTQDGALDIVATALKALQAGDPETIITAAGDIIQGGALGVPQRLAIGTANQMLQVNAGATALEYAKIINANIDAAAAIATSKLADGSNFVQQTTATGTITSAQILALNATPIELIAAPAAGTAIVVDEIQLFLDFGAAAYVAGAGEDLTIQYSGGVVVASIDNDAVTFLTDAADEHWYGKCDQIYTVGASGSGDGILLSTIDAEALQVTIATGEVTTGDSDIKYSIKYRVVTLLS